MSEKNKSGSNKRYSATLQWHRNTSSTNHSNQTKWGDSEVKLLMNTQDQADSGNVSVCHWLSHQLPSLWWLQWSFVPQILLITIFLLYKAKIVMNVRIKCRQNCLNSNNWTFSIIVQSLFKVTISREVIHLKLFNCWGFGINIAEMPVYFHFIAIFFVYPQPSMIWHSNALVISPMDIILFIQLLIP